MLHAGTVESKANCKVMVLGCGLECTTTEAKGTVLIHTAEELKNFTKGEEAQMEDIIKGIKNAGTYLLPYNFISPYFCCVITEGVRHQTLLVMPQQIQARGASSWRPGRGPANLRSYTAS